MEYLSRSNLYNNYWGSVNSISNDHPILPPQAAYGPAAYGPAAAYGGYGGPIGYGSYGGYWKTNLNAIYLFHLTHQNTHLFAKKYSAYLVCNLYSFVAKNFVSLNF